MEKLLIVDGNSIINRAFYAIKYLTSKDGMSTGALYGFLNILMRKIEEEQPDYTAVAFDLKAPTFRHKEYSLYKAQRKGMPEELAMQMPIAKELLNAMNIAVLELEGYEADDIIGTVAATCERKNVLCQILTGDKDDLQLATDKTQIHLTVTTKGQTETKVYTSAEVLDRYSLTPTQFIDLKGLMGDPSDNIPGVKGVGEKTAISLLLKYGSVEGVYEHIDDGEIKGALYNKLKEDKEMAFLSKKLATIMLDVPLDFTLEDLKAKPYNVAEFAKILDRLDFKTILKKLDVAEEPAAVVQTITRAGDSCDVEEIIKTGELCYVLDADKVFVKVNDEIAEFSDIQILKSIFEDKNITKTAHNAKDDIVFLSQIGIQFDGLGFDTAIAAYILDPAESEYNYSDIIEKYLGSSAAKDITSILKLKEKLLSLIKENEQEQLYFDIELPLVTVLAKMQINGFKVDKQMLMDFSKKLSADIEGLENSIYMLAGEVFNINSPKQLGVVLFEHLGLPAQKKTKSGYSTNADVLNKLKKYHPIIECILDYRQLAKLKSTYADGLSSVINEKTGKIHSCFNQTITATGRISSTEPNLQNIPVKLELGREIRKVFVASDSDHILIDADYSQIELRVLAHVAEDAKMREAFANDLDIHTQTASQVFGVAEFMVTPQMRSRAKAVNFGIVYGIGEFSLAEDIGTTRKEAKEYIESYLNTYTGVDKFMKDTVEFAKENGYVKTLFNRRRYIPEIKSSNFNIRSFGERAAMNAPIQGSAADIIKLAMIGVYNELKEKAPKSRLILQVHDELIVEAHVDEKETVTEIIKNQMEKAYALAVPLKVDVGIGENWYEAK